MEYQLGQMFGPFQLRTLVAEDAHGVVYRAYDTDLERHVLLRLIHPDQVADPQAHARFAAEIQDPQLARVLSYGEHAGIPYVVLEDAQTEPPTDTHPYPHEPPSTTHPYPIPPPVRRTPFWAWGLLLALTGVVVIPLMIRWMSASSPQSSPTAALLSTPAPDLARPTATSNPSADSSNTNPAGRLPATLPPIDVHNAPRLDLLDILGGPGEIIAWSPDGQQIAINDSLQVRIVDLNTFEEINRFDAPNEHALFTPDWSFMALSVQDRIEIWEVASGRSVRALRGHTAPILALEIDSTGQILASAGQDQTIRLWEVATGNAYQELSGHTAAVTSIAFTPDGTQIASASADGTIRLWDVATGSELRQLSAIEGQLGEVGTIEQMVMVPDGSFVVAAQSSDSGDSRLIRWDLHTGEMSLLSLFGFREPSCIAMAPNAQLLVVCLNSTLISMLDPHTGQDSSLLDFHANDIRQISFSPDSRMLIMQISNGLQFWGVTRAAPQAFQPISAENANQLQLVASISPGFMPIEADQSIPYLAIAGISINPDGDSLTVATGDIFDPRQGALIRYDLLRGEVTQTLPTVVRALTASADGRWLAGMLWDGQITLWDAQSLTIVRSFPLIEDYSVSLALSPDGTLLAAQSQGTVHLWEIASESEIFSLQGTWASVTFSPDSTMLAVGSTNEVRLLDPRSGDEIRTLHGGVGTTLTFAPNGQLLAGSGMDRDYEWHVALWDLTDTSNMAILLEQRRINLSDTGQLAFAPDSSLLLSGSAGVIRCWRTDDYSPIREFQAHTYPIEVVWLAFTPNGEHLISAANDGVIHRWGVGIE